MKITVLPQGVFPNGYETAIFRLNPCDMLREEYAGEYIRYSIRPSHGTNRPTFRAQFSNASPNASRMCFSSSIA